MPATPSTLDEALTGSGQFQNYHHIVAVGTQRYQTRIRFDCSHADQSTCHVDFWTPAGWTPVVTLHGRDPRVVALPSGYGPDITNNVKGFRDLHRELLALARVITKSPESAAIG